MIYLTLRVTLAILDSPVDYATEQLAEAGFNFYDDENLPVMEFSDDEKKGVVVEEDGENTVIKYSDHHYENGDSLGDLLRELELRSGMDLRLQDGIFKLEMELANEDDVGDNVDQMVDSIGTIGDYFVDDSDY
jgi:hypothetical protein